MGEQKKSDDHLMKQDASSVNPMKLTALTPEVVCSFRESNLSSSFCFLSFFRSVSFCSLHYRYVYGYGSCYRFVKRGMKMLPSKEFCIMKDSKT